MNEQQYETISARRTAFDGLIWQTPALAAALQGFLLATSFDPDTPPKNAIILSLFSLVVGIATIQLMAKHRYHERRDAALLEEYERANAEKGYSILHGTRQETAGVQLNCFTKISSVHVWIAMFVLFCILGGYGLYNSYEKYQNARHSVDAALSYTECRRTLAAP